MTTDGKKNDGNRDRDRTEAAFDALSTTPAKAPEPEPGNPWKPAALLLLLMALALPLAFGIRASRVRIEFEGRVAEASLRTTEVRRLAEAGDLPGAISAMSRVTDALADVDGLLDATVAVRRGAERQNFDLLAEQHRVADRDARIDQNRRVVDALLAGDPRDASRLIGGTKSSGALEDGLERLALRLDALCMAFEVEGEARVSALELLSTAWNLPIVKSEMSRATEQLRRAREASVQLSAAREARRNDQIGAARESLDLACRSMGVSGVGEEFAELRVMELNSAGKRLQADGDHAGAAACFELAGKTLAAQGERSAATAEIEAGRRKYLIDRLEQRLSAAPDPRARAAIASMLAELTGDQSRQQEAAAWNAKDLLEQARAFRAKGELEAALAVAAAAKDVEGAEGFRQSVSAELVRNAAAKRLEQAEAVLTLGGPAYAAWLVAKNETQPAQLMQKIRAARLAQAVTRSRALFDRGDFAAARDALEGQPADDAEVQELHRRLILATDDGNFVVELPKDRKQAEALLYRAILRRFQTDPVAAGKILKTYEKSPAGIVPALVAFLDAADSAEQREIWKALKAEVEKRFPKPEEKPAPVKEK